ncbi:hypothetical protein [Spirillospora sp. NPDC048819]|uniref:hypothetical protein n=1 Tax=Spirillospora sp. NPDC048819 TaxID=3155268 RepID=UPI0033F2C2D3
MIAEAGSRAGTGGTSTSPAPSIPRLLAPLEPVPRVPPRDAVRPDPTVPRPLPTVPPDDEPGPLERDGADGPDEPDDPDVPDEPGCLVVGGATGVRVVTAAPACGGPTGAGGGM